jgi:hypothetical protein
MRSSLLSYKDNLKKDLKIAIVHDAFVVPAGSERVALHISNLFPEAPIFTAAYLPENTYPEFKNRRSFPPHPIFEKTEYKKEKISALGIIPKGLKSMAWHISERSKPPAGRQQYK